MVEIFIYRVPPKPESMEFVGPNMLDGQKFIQIPLPHISGSVDMKLTRGAARQLADWLFALTMEED